MTSITKMHGTMNIKKSCLTPITLRVIQSPSFCLLKLPPSRIMYRVTELIR